jgi:hypothetical protein
VSSDANVSPQAIDLAPENPPAVTLTADEYQAVLAEYGRLQTSVDDLTVENARLQGSSEVARSQLIKPYAWAVLRFLCCYGGVVGALLFFQGFHTLGFKLNDTVMGVVVGSTAVSAIGLVLTIVRGLFPAAKG